MKKQKVNKRLDFEDIELMNKVRDLLMKSMEDLDNDDIDEKKAVSQAALAAQVINVMKTKIEVAKLTGDNSILGIPYIDHEE